MKSDIKNDYDQTEVITEVDKLTVQLHALIVAGKGNSDEADDLRDQLDFPWYKATIETRKLIDRLNIDLFWLHAQTFGGEDKTKLEKCPEHEKHPDDQVKKPPEPGETVTLATQECRWLDVLIGLARNRPVHDGDKSPILGSTHAIYHRFDTLTAMAHAYQKLGCCEMAKALRDFQKNSEQPEPWPG